MKDIRFAKFLVLLNGAREPALWKRLRDTRVSADLAGAPADLVSGVVAQPSGARA